MTEKKNQHYIPKFYLRKFSFKGNGKQIGLFNVSKEFFYPTATLKNQGSKDFFYGTDGIIEDGLSQMEGELADTLKQIIEDRKVPHKGSKSHANMLLFVALTHLRNPVLIQNMKDMVTSQQIKATELDPNLDPTRFFPNIDHQYAIQLALSSIPDIVNNITDMDFKLLINRTKNPFITSDFPVVKFNQYLTRKNWEHGKTGYGHIGLEIIIPLNDELSIILYDVQIYNVGDKKKDYLGITKEKDVRQLNELQVLNCYETIYFNEKANESEIRKIAEITKKATKPNEIFSQLHYLSDQQTRLNPKKENLIVTGSTDIDIEFKIDGISINSGYKKRKLSNAMAQLRPVPMQLMKERDKNKKHRQN